MSKIDIEKKEREQKLNNKSTARTQERKKEDTWWHARGLRILQTRKQREGGVSPRRNDRITESATNESKEAKRKRQSR